MIARTTRDEGVDRDREGAGGEQAGAHCLAKREAARDLPAPAMAIGSNPLSSTMFSVTYGASLRSMLELATV
jgi:hypothetical protein